MSKWRLSERALLALTFGRERTRGACAPADSLAHVALPTRVSLSSTTIMPSAHLPPVSALSDPASPPPILEAFLALLLEPTLVLKVKLVPEVLASTSAVPSLSYEAVLDRAEEVVSGWGWDDKATFVEGHRE